MPSERPSLSERLRKRVGRTVVDHFFNLTAKGGRLLPNANPKRHDVEVVANIPYRDTGRPEHLLDVYRPTGPAHVGPRPVVLYVHGGGFRILSKETHWLMALIFARRGYLTFNINYRLAPEHPFPAAIEDVCAAYGWVVDHAAEYGGDIDRLVLSGESAGANLITSLTLAICNPRDEPHAKAAWEKNVVPRAVLPACGIFQVSEVERFAPTTNRLILDRLEEVSHFYLPRPDDFENLDLVDPVVALERGEAFARALPPFFMICGTADVLMDETRRLKDALSAAGVTCEARYYQGGMHAFHAFIWQEKARRSWTDTFEFLDQHI